MPPWSPCFIYSVMNSLYTHRHSFAALPLSPAESCNLVPSTIWFFFKSIHYLGGIDRHATQVHPWCLACVCTVSGICLWTSPLKPFAGKAAGGAIRKSWGSFSNPIGCSCIISVREELRGAHFLGGPLWSIRELLPWVILPIGPHWWGTLQGNATLPQALGSLSLPQAGN